MGPRGGPLRRRDAGLGLGRLRAAAGRPTEEGPAELEAAKAAITALTQQPHQGRAVRRGPAAPGAAGARSPRRPSSSPTSTCAPAATGTTSTGGRAPARSSSRRRGRCRRCRRRPRSARHAPLRAGARPPARRRAGRRRPPARLPLAGLKVLDLTWVFAGPLATRVLADFGATVVKVEGPAHPDASRGGGGALRGDLGLEGSVAFAHFNCGKLGLSLDLNNARPDATSCSTSSRWADVLVESFTPGVMEAWGLGYEALREVNPRARDDEHQPDGPDRAAVDVRRVRQPGRRHHRLLRADRLARPGAGRPVPRLHRLRRAPLHASPPLLAALDWRRRTGRRPAPRPVPGRGGDPLPRPGHPRPHRQRRRPDPRWATPTRSSHPHGVYPLRRRRPLGGDRLRDRRAAGGARRRWSAGSTDEAVEAWTATRDRGRGRATLQARRRARARRAEQRRVLAPTRSSRTAATTSPSTTRCTTSASSRARASCCRARPASCAGPDPTLGEHNDVVLRELLGYDDDQVTDLVIAGALG